MSDELDDCVDALVALLKVSRSQQPDELRVAVRSTLVTFLSDGSSRARDRMLSVREVAAEARDAAQDRREHQQDERDELREMLMGTLSHDLRNPLGTIVMGSSLLMKSGRLTSADTRVVARMARSAGRMTRMIGQLLDYTRIRLGGGFAIARGRMDLNAAVQDSVDELAVSFPEHRLSLARIEDGVICADRDCISQVLSNLLGNALEHSPQGSTVSVRLSRATDTVSVEVHNVGAPIPRSLLPSIFEPFRSGSPNRSGLGLGLYIAREIVAAHGGAIRATSNEQDGTSFEVSLPA